MTRVLQKNELQNFRQLDYISKFEDVTEEKLKKVRNNFQVYRDSKRIICYVLDTTAEIPVITYCIKILKNLSVELFYKNARMHQPGWFRDGKQGNGRLTSYSMIENFINYMKNKLEEDSSILDELLSQRYQTRPTYSNQVVRFAIHLRYTSLEAYNLLLEHLKLPSVFYIRSITSGELSYFMVRK